MTEDITPEEKEPTPTKLEKEEKLDDYTIAKKLVSLKASADSRNIDFDLKFTTVKRLLSNKQCFYTGKKFTKSGKNSRTIDRVDNSMGYVEGNVVPCTSEMNAKKGNLKIEEILSTAEKIKKHLKK